MIRPARPEDYAAISEIWTPVVRDTVIIFHSDPRSPERVRAVVEERRALGHEFFVAQSEGQIAGFATYAQFRSGDGYARTMEHSVILGPSAQGHGLGRALMQAVEAHAAAAGALSMIAGVSAENVPGLAFHAALGYREVGMIPAAGFKFGRPLDLVLMQKMLGEAADSESAAG